MTDLDQPGRTNSVCRFCLDRLEAFDVFSLVSAANRMPPYEGRVLRRNAG
jgi:hypothetical protein